MRCLAVIVRRIELGAGLLAGLAFLGAGVYPAIFPMSQGTACTYDGRCTDTAPAIPVFLHDPPYAIFAVLLGLLGGSVVVGLSFWHSHEGEGRALIALWFVTILLVGLSMIVTGLGLLLVVAIPVSLVACIVGTIAELRSIYRKSRVRAQSRGDGGQGWVR